MFTYYLLFLNLSLFSQFVYLQPHENEISSIIEWALNHQNKNVARLGAKALRRIIESACCLSINEGESNCDDDEHKKNDTDIHISSNDDMQQQQTNGRRSDQANYGAKNNKNKFWKILG